MKASISTRNTACMRRQCRKNTKLGNPSSCCHRRFLRGETSMRPQVLLVVALAVFAVLVALPLGKAHEEEGVDASASPWPCCDECGVCTRSQPPTCECLDTSTSGCNPECKACVKSISDGLYECKDRIVNFCKRRCTRPVAADDA